MLWSKFAALLFLIRILLTGSWRQVREQFRHGFFSGCVECCRMLGRLTKMVWVLTSNRGSNRVEAMYALTAKVNSDTTVYYQNPHTALFAVRGDFVDQKYEEIINRINPLLSGKHGHARLYGARGFAYFNLGLYRQAYEDLHRCHALRPDVSYAHFYNLTRSYLESLFGNIDAARSAVGEQLIHGSVNSTGSDIARDLEKRVHLLLDPVRGDRNVGVYIFAPIGAVGHAILDPFHVYNLFVRDFDDLILLQQQRKDFTPATLVAAGILEQYFERIEIDDHKVMMCSWQNLGTVTHENTNFLLYHYWELNRQIFKARRDPQHPLSRRRQYFVLPIRARSRAELFCRRQGIDLDRPIVVVHVREQEYHKLRVQSFRNMNVQNYIPALRRLVDRGYQVVRIGDAKMTCVADSVPGLIELPKMDGYTPLLDPFFISQCEFMISCQSGPCSYARAFGKPNLALNAVYHYTLIPEAQELFGFKDYRNRKTGARMSVEEIFREGIHLLDRAEHFNQHDIELVEMTPDEIIASVDEMLEWMRNKDLPREASQLHFRDLMEYSMLHPATHNPMATPFADYIGYALPEFRLSNAVAELRSGFFEDESMGWNPQPLAKSA